jgi:hypothetical protein
LRGGFNTALDEEIIGWFVEEPLWQKAWFR